jgi:tetratricopeptide (TPR) repeat protein
VVALAVAMALVPATAQAGELNLWISYYFQGTDSQEAGRYADADVLLNHGLEEVEAMWRKADTLDSLGLTYMALGRYQEAEDCFQEALCIKEKYCGPCSRGVATTLNHLGDLHFVAGDINKCEPAYRRALAITEKDQLSVEVCRALNGLALLFNKDGNTVEAENHLQRAIKIHRKAQRAEHPYLATNLVNLAILYTKQGRYSEAEPLFARADFVHRKSLGDSHPDIAIRLQAYAGYLVETNQIPAAREAKNRAEEIEAHFAELNKA